MFSSFHTCSRDWIFTTMWKSQGSEDVVYHLELGTFRLFAACHDCIGRWHQFAVFSRSTLESSQFHRYSHCHNSRTGGDNWNCYVYVWLSKTTGHMMTTSNGNIFRVTGHLCGKFTSLRWIPRTKASDAELWYFLWSAPEINGWVNNREAGDLRRHRTHYDVTIMKMFMNSGQHV